MEKEKELKQMGLSEDLIDDVVEFGFSCEDLDDEVVDDLKEVREDLRKRKKNASKKQQQIDNSVSDKESDNTEQLSNRG